MAADARKWWLGELARRANDSDAELAALAITPEQVARVASLVSDGTLTDRLARQVIDAVLAGEGDPDAVVAARGLAVMTDEGALTTAIDAAIAANPDVAAKVRDGKVAAAGPARRRRDEGNRRQGRRRPRPCPHPGTAELAPGQRGRPSGEGAQWGRPSGRGQREGLARERGAAPGAGAWVQRATGLAGAIGPRGAGWRRGGLLGLTGQQHGDEGRHLFLGRVAAYHPQHRFTWRALLGR